MTDTLKNRVVLIVDDESSNIYALTSYLEYLDLKCIVAHNGIEGLEALKTHPEIEIVLLDMMMPEMDGYEMLKLLSESSKIKQLPVIAVTAKAMKGDKEKCIEAGAWDYVSKPINTAELIEKITKWIS